jgi:ElaB/YqjD/DUF883 family membrane-anchored ribosome-binding protein
MADTPLKPMTDANVQPPADTDFIPAAPLKDAGIDFAPEAADAASGTLAGAKSTLREGTANLRGQAEEKARGLAEQGKARATDALGQLSQMLNDAAGQVDEKLGTQYGQYARSAADRVQGFSSQLDEQSIDDLVDAARDLVRKSPAVAIGAAAAIGFVVARLLSAGLDQRDHI